MLFCVRKAVKNNNYLSLELDTSFVFQFLKNLSMAKLF